MILLPLNCNCSQVVQIFAGSSSLLPTYADERDREKLVYL